MKTNDREAKGSIVVGELLARQGRFTRMDYREYNHKEVHAFTHNNIVEVARSNNIFQMILFLPVFLYSLEFDADSSITPEEKKLIISIIKNLINKINSPRESLSSQDKAIDPNERGYLLRLYNQFRYMTSLADNPEQKYSKDDLALFIELRDLIKQYI